MNSHLAWPSRIYGIKEERWLLCVLLYVMCAGRSPKTTARHMCDNVFITGASSSSTTRRVLNEIYQEKSRKHVRHRARPRHISPAIFLSLSLSSVFIEEKGRYNINEQKRERLNKRPSSSFLKLFTFCLAQWERFPTVDVATSIKSQLKVQLEY